MRILTTREFEEGKIPRKEEFKPILEEFEQDCVIPFLGKEVVGSFAYGSVNRGDYNVASDIDYLMIIDNETHKKRIREANQKAYAKSCISIQTRVINVKNAQAGFHSIDPSFKQHLELSVKRYGHRGNNPLELLADNGIPFKEALRVSMSKYLSKMNNIYTNPPKSEGEYIQFLRDIMEKPFHAMRVAIQFQLGSVAPEQDHIFNDTKSELIRIYSGLGFDRGLMDNIEKLRRTARDYVRLLEDRQKEKIPRSEYGVYPQMLDRIEDCYSHAYHFIEQNAREKPRKP